MKHLKKNLKAIIEILFLLTIGILLLINPTDFPALLIKAAGVLLIAAGVVGVIRYFRAKPEVAAKGRDFFRGSVLISGGIFAFFATKWFLTAFPALAVLYGVMQIALGYLKAQKSLDALRAKEHAWWLKAISAGISILFGFIISLNPNMNFIGIWVFTGLTLIIEGVFDLMILVMTWSSRGGKAPADDQPPMSDGQSEADGRKETGTPAADPEHEGETKIEEESEGEREADE